MDVTAARASLPTAPTHDDLALLDRVVPDPVRPGPDRWRVVDGDLPVWAIIQHLIAEGDLADAAEADDALIARTADDYRIPEAGVRAAIAYYRANRGAIDSLIATHAGAPPNLVPPPPYRHVDLPAPVKPDPHRLGIDRWRLVTPDLPVWPIIMHIYMVADIDADFRTSPAAIADAADAYGISEQDVLAALAFYAANPAAIDTLLAANADATLTPRRR